MQIKVWLGFFSVKKKYDRNNAIKKPPLNHALHETRTQKRTFGILSLSSVWAMQDTVSCDNCYNCGENLQAQRQLKTFITFQLWIWKETAGKNVCPARAYSPGSIIYFTRAQISLILSLP